MRREIAHQKSFAKALPSIQPTFPPGKFPELPPIHNDSGNKRGHSHSTSTSTSSNQNRSAASSNHRGGDRSPSGHNQPEQNNRSQSALL